MLYYLNSNETNNQLATTYRGTKLPVNGVVDVVDPVIADEVGPVYGVVVVVLPKKITVCYAVLYFCRVVYHFCIPV